MSYKKSELGQSITMVTRTSEFMHKNDRLSYVLPQINQFIQWVDNNSSTLFLMRAEMCPASVKERYLQFQSNSLKYDEERPISAKLIANRAGSSIEITTKPACLYLRKVFLPVHEADYVQFNSDGNNYILGTKRFFNSIRIIFAGVGIAIHDIGIEQKEIRTKFAEFKASKEPKPEEQLMSKFRVDIKPIPKAVNAIVLDTNEPQYNAVPNSNKRTASSLLEENSEPDANASKRRRIEAPENNFEAHFTTVIFSALSAQEGVLGMLRNGTFFPKPPELKNGTSECETPSSNVPSRS